MNKSNITAHMIVRNEDRFIWYAICSVLAYVDKFLIFDTGSSDKTVEIIKLFANKKINFEEKGKVDAKRLTELRQEQIERTETPWIWIVDGDEIYPKKTAEKILQIVKGRKKYEGIIVHRYDLLADVYHFQDEKVGTYNQFGVKGHYVLRLINKKAVESLQVLGDYPNEYFADATGKSIKRHSKEKFAFVEERFFHAMYLRRSTRLKGVFPLKGLLGFRHYLANGDVLNRKKPKIELGRKIPIGDLPEAFFKEKPSLVPEVTGKMSFTYKLLAFLITPVKWIKRSIFN